MKKLLIVLISVLMVFSVAGCKEKVEKDDSPLAATVEADLSNYDEVSETLFESVLGSYYNYYTQAKENASNNSERYALMAISEAKLLESAILLPLTAKGGNYAVGRAVPMTVSSVLWGNDSEKYYAAVSTNEFITNTDRDTLKGMWKNLAGTGTYLTEAVKWLEANGYTVNDTYTMGYSSDPQTWDMLGTSQSADSEAIVNTVDGLFEYDIENTQTPALATGVTVSEDGLTYTFTIRQGAKWVDSQGRYICDVTAGDWVAAMQHCCDVQEGLEYLFGVSGAHIVNADEYVAGVVTDFNEVGVKALDDYTLQYTLTEPTAYFMTMLGYGVFTPMCKTYFLSQGGVFGVDAWASCTTAYGTDPEHIAYCGPYLAVATAENSIVFTANESYYNKDKVWNKTITWLYNDGSDVLKSYNDCKAGILTAAGLNASAAEQAKVDGLFDQNVVYTTGTDATSYCAFFNINRNNFSNVNDNTTVVSTQTVNQAAKTQAAMQNVHFRRALMMALDRASYNAQTDGEELKYAAMINSFTPGKFVQLEEEVTVEINGTAKTYAAGTYYGQILQDQLDADGVKIKAWDAEAEGGIGSSAQYDGWYNVDNAKAELEVAIKELKAAGVTVSAANPVVLDLPAYAASEVYLNRANVFKQSVEAAFGGAVIVNVTECQTAKEWYYAGYYTNTGYQANYDIYDVSGWGPDYGDPATYLDNFIPGGYMMKSLGIY